MIITKPITDEDIDTRIVTTNKSNIKTYKPIDNTPAHHLNAAGWGWIPNDEITGLIL